VAGRNRVALLSRRRPRRRRSPAALALLVLGLAGGRALAQDAALPAGLQVSLLADVLSYDRNLRGRAGTELVVGVLYQRRFRPALDLQLELLEAAARQPATAVAGLPWRWVAVEIEGGEELAAALERLQVDMVYVTPLRALPLAAVTDATRRRQATTVTAVPEYVAAGVAVGFGLRGDRPQILVNRAAAAAEGSDLGSQLLRPAKVVG